MPSRPPETEPMTVQVLSDEVAISGPDGLGLSLTADAAAESARRLKAAAETIRTGGGHLVNGTEDEDDPSAP
jgi:hypothetical protein